MRFGLDAPEECSLFVPAVLALVAGLGTLAAVLKLA
jgi:hypothetical protein